jgi:hypothetical protein
MAGFRMNPSVLFIVASDPRTSPRPAEAVRIAAGVGACKTSDIRFYLRAAAILALSEYPDDFVEGDNYTRYLPLVAESGHPIYVQRGSPFLAELGETLWPFQPITDDELAALSAQSTYAARF